MPKTLFAKDDMLLSYADMQKFLKVSRSTVFRMAEAGEIPAPIRITAKTTRWRMSDIKRWIKKCKPRKVKKNG